MQTDAEKYLITLLKKFLALFPKKAKILNLGAANSVIIEEELVAAGLNFICDRSDIQSSTIEKPYIGRSFICSIENMDSVSSSEYDCVFANFVLEHISDPQAAASEMARILKPGGNLILSLSNPLAPEFLLAKVTPTSFHQIWREEDHDPAYPTKYAYGSISNLIKLLKNSGLRLQEDRRFPAIYSYLFRFPLLNYFGLAYDKLLKVLKLKSIMGHCVLHLEK